MVKFFKILFFMCCAQVNAGDLSWPIDCEPGDSRCSRYIGYPDVDSDAKAFNCDTPGYTGHEGTDISAAAGTSVFAAGDGVVLWTFDGKYDDCRSDHPDCQPPFSGFYPGASDGYMVCTESGPYCDAEGLSTGCYWCFFGGNVVVIKHDKNVFATRYDHLKKDSILVAPGEKIRRGKKIAEVGSAGSSTGSHLHFEVWGENYYDPVDPWAG